MTDLRKAAEQAREALKMAACDCNPMTGRCWDRNIARGSCLYGAAADALRKFDAKFIAALDAALAVPPVDPVETIHRVTAEHTISPEKARAFLQAGGLLTEDGQLPEGLRTPVGPAAIRRAALDEAIERCDAVASICGTATAAYAAARRCQDAIRALAEKEPTDDDGT